MLARQRQERILEALRASGGVRVSDLTEQLNVSYMTIRRDLDALAERGLVEKVHGGATIAGRSRSADEPGFEAKSRARARRRRRRSPRRPRELVQPGTAIGVTAGTTTWTLARYLRDIPNLTVVTNSIPVARVMRHDGRTDLSVVLTGGLRTPSDALVGPVADAAVRAMHVDLLFMGVHGMDERGGFTTPNLLEAETNRALVRSARAARRRRRPHEVGHRRAEPLRPPAGGPCAGDRQRTAGRGAARCSRDSVARLVLAPVNRRAARAVASPDGAGVR